jgi:hypothetical protein
MSPLYARAQLGAARAAALVSDRNAIRSACEAIASAWREADEPVRQPAVHPCAANGSR